MQTRRPVSVSSRSATSSATSSERRNAPAKPSNSKARSRIPARATSMDKILLRPMNPVVKDGLLPARHKFFAFGLRELQLARESINNVGHAVFAAIARQLQYRQH